MSRATLTVAVDKEDGKYAPGEQVHGVVTLRFRRRRLVRRVVAQLVGESVVRAYGRCRRRERRFEHVRLRSLLAGTEGWDQTVEVNASTTTYAYTFALPGELPSSVSGEGGGRTTYAVNAFVEFPGATFRLRSCVLIRVEAPIDLNTLAAAYCRFSLDLVGVPTAPPNLMLKVEAPRCGYNAGETMTLTAVAKNESACPVDRIRVAIVRIFHCSADGKTRTSRRVVAHTRLPDINEECAWSRTRHIQLPSHLDPSGLGRARIIDVEYVCEVQLRVRGNTFTVQRPIVVGTVPFEDNKQLESASDLLQPRPTIYDE